MHFSFPAIGVIHSCFKEKFGIPRQPGLAPLARAQLELLPPYDDPAAIEGLTQSSHIWLQFVFHANRRDTWKPKVKPPRLGGNKSLGVFATRSPVRPSPIGLSVVRLDAIRHEQGKLWLDLSGIDFLDGTPVLDIKPYIPYVDRVENATNSFAAQPPALLPVIISARLMEVCAAYQTRTGTDLAGLIHQVLQQDPRPQYQQPQAERLYGMNLLDLNIRWRYELLDDSLSIHLEHIDLISTASA